MRVWVLMLPEENLAKFKLVAEESHAPFWVDKNLGYLLMKPVLKGQFKSTHILEPKSSRSLE